MADFSIDPPATAATAATDTAVATPNLLQTIRMAEAGRSIGLTRWHSPADSGDGVVQILDFVIEPPHRRQGYGKRLLAATVQQWIAYQRARQLPLRSAWLVLGHKRHVIARAFFMSQGFTHVATIRDVLREEDGLVYVRTFN